MMFYFYIMKSGKRIPVHTAKLLFLQNHHHYSLFYQPLRHRGPRIHSNQKVSNHIKDKRRKQKTGSSSSSSSSPSPPPKRKWQPKFLPSRRLATKKGQNQCTLNRNNPNSDVSNKSSTRKISPDEGIEQETLDCITLLATPHPQSSDQPMPRLHLLKDAEAEMTFEEEMGLFL